MEIDRKISGPLAGGRFDPGPKRAGGPRRSRGPGGRASHLSNPHRKLQLEHYLSLFLFGLLNPAVCSMRALCEASDLDRMCRDICGRPVSLGSFSETQILVTNQPPEQLSGDMVSELYRSRWQIELYFRWIKCILGNRHWLAESERGVTLQLHTGERPSKRMQERIGLYLMGMATLEELRVGLAREQARRAARLAKKQKP